MSEPGWFEQLGSVADAIGFARWGSPTSPNVAAAEELMTRAERAIAPRAAAITTNVRQRQKFVGRCREYADWADKVHAPALAVRFRSLADTSAAPLRGAR